jgi:putative LysE/RhtB family amino acid efflux pump
VLVLIGGRAIWSALRVRTGGEADIEVARPARAFLTTVAATASNPLTIVSWAAVFASASVAGAVDGTADALLLVLGIGIGTALWKSALTALTVLAGRRLGERTIRTVDVVSGVGLIGFGSVLAWRTTVEA